jgi:hydroxymethylbilane synthase
VGQGVLAVEARALGELARAAEAITHRPTAERWAAERAVLVRLGADCNVPLAAYAEHTARGTLRLRALLAAGDGARILRAEVEGPPAEAARLGTRAAETILRDGGEALLAQLRRGARVNPAGKAASIIGAGRRPRPDQRPQRLAGSRRGGL